MRDYIKLLSFLKGHNREFGLAVVFMFIASLLQGVQYSLLVPLTDRILTNKKIVLPNKVPHFLQNIVDKFNATDTHILLWLVPLLFFIMILVRLITTFLYDYLMNDISQKIMRDIRSQLYEKIQNLSLEYFSKKRTGELVSRITNDVQTIENGVSYAVTDMIRQPFLILTNLVIVFMVYAHAAGAVILLVILVIWPMSVFGKRLRKLAKGSQEKMADISSHLLETISGIRVVKAFSMENYEIERFKKNNQEFYKYKIKGIKRSLILSPVVELLGTVFGLAVFMILGKQVMQGHLSFGVFGLFLAGILQIISPVKKLANVHAITQQALAANSRIYEVLDARATVLEKNHPQELGIIRQKIEFKNVNFGYDHESGLVLQGINLEIKVGELVAIVGPTGTGKSTLVNLIPRFYDPTEGQVFIDGVDIKTVSFQSLRSQIGIVNQEAILFNDTVRANISYGFFEASEEKIQEAADRAFAHSFISKMPHGFGTIVGDRGFRLSGGEKQRLTIARAILRNPPILILDEATSQLDSESEKFVQQALDEIMHGRTVVAIAHRLSTIIKADQIVVLEAGRVVGLGKHQDLLKTCPLYKRLYETQFSNPA
ncbi:MAG: ABC transporter ATP-binding protein [Candidatus Omnitrophica bacterium]|nr:ABC transporter ATP-binding protein [Candidatus Omnitrophota bacterium]